jgi:alpha-tubulin suppressor-like RCC1 family protein
LSLTAVATGLFHTCGLTSSGAAYCWGYNHNGELGRATFDYSTVPVAVAAF